MEQEIAVIDCGTNTFNLLIASINNNGLKILIKKKRVVKLAQDFDNKIICDKAIIRAENAMVYFKQIINESKIHRNSVYCVGTSAIREAKNQIDFIREVYSATKIKIEPISGLQEATYIFKGILEEHIFSDECVLIMDIGGGSVEFIISIERKIVWKKSFPIGAAKILNRIQPHFPFNTNDVKAISNLFDSELNELISAIEKYQPHLLIGSSGSFDSLISIRNKLFLKVGIEEQNNRLKANTFQLIFKELIKKDYPALLKTPGLLRMRAKMIVPSIMLIKFVIQKMGKTEIIVSKYSLKEGLAFSILTKK
jgi:exopolyphosphatase/guanosine-5'-triphosphate,3'-diphosphate pyrophosphatase